MESEDPDLNELDRGRVVAPAGCGKTELIVRALASAELGKPVLVLTHTNAGVAALRSRLTRACVDPRSYRLSTIDGWAIRLVSTFPLRSAHDPSAIEGGRPDYLGIREAAEALLARGDVDDVVCSSYSRLLVDEYQDCSIRQHRLICRLSALMPSCVVGDPLQSIFGFGGDPLADWNRDVCGQFADAGELTTPWRWINAGTEEFGHWLLDARQRLLDGSGVDMTMAPSEVVWIQLDGSAGDHAKRLGAARSRGPAGKGSVLILGESTSPRSQRQVASQTPGATTVEAVDLRDLVDFGRRLDLGADSLLDDVANFAQEVMTNVGAADLVRRVGSLRAGRARKAASDAEAAAIRLLDGPTLGRVADLLVEINKEGGVRAFRPAVLSAALRALQIASPEDGPTLGDAAVRVREESRLRGRALPHRAVGSTLLLKGLEADVAVVLNADSLSRENLYVAMTRGSKRLVICSSRQILGGR